MEYVYCSSASNVLVCLNKVTYEDPQSDVTESVLKVC